MKLAKPVYKQAWEKGFELAKGEVKEVDGDKIFIQREVQNQIKSISVYDDPHPRFKKVIANKTAIIV